MLTDPSPFHELAAEVSAISGHTIRDWEITTVADKGWVMGALRTRGTFNLAIDHDGNFLAYHRMMPEAALDALAQQVAQREPSSGATEDGSRYFRVDRLGWQLTFRRFSPDAPVEVWSVAEQSWQATGLLQLLKNGDQALVRMDKELADQWAAFKPGPAAAGATTPNPRYFLLNEPPPAAALWLAPAVDATLQWRQFVAAEGRMVLLTDAELDQLRGGRELVEVNEPAFDQALAALWAAHKQSQS